MVFGRGKHTPTTDPAPGEGHCALCGEAVPIGDDGRCGLGHRATPPREAKTPDEDAGAFGPLPEPAEAAAAGLAAPDEDHAPEPDAEDAEDGAEEEDHFASLYGFIEEEDPEADDEAGERDEP